MLTRRCCAVSGSETFNSVLQIGSSLAQQIGRILKLPNRLIAASAEQSAHLIRNMVVVESEPGLSRIAVATADCADATLSREHLGVGSDGYAVFGRKASISGGLGISPISAAICLPVLPWNILGLIGLHAGFAGCVPAVIGVPVSRERLHFSGLAAVDADLHSIGRPRLSAKLRWLSHRGFLLSHRAWLAGCVATILTGFASMKIDNRFHDSANATRFFVHYTLAKPPVFGIV